MQTLNAKNLWKCIFRASWRVCFSYFLKVALDREECPLITFRTFAIVIQYSIQALCDI